jgi:hypothetical protein
MHSGPALPFRVPFKHREVNDPQTRPAFLDKLEVLTNLDPQRADGIVHDLRLVRTDTNLPYEMSAQITATTSL